MADPLIGLTFHFDLPAKDPASDAAPRGGNGSQVLPVADLDADFDGSPEDGSQYLALVRREAATHARIHRVANPYEVLEGETDAQEEAAPSSRPTEAWREVFVRNFEEARKRMLAAPIHSLPPIDPASIPAPRDESTWRVFINGKRAKAARVTTGSSAKPVSVPEAVSKPVASAAGEDTEMSDLAAAKAALLASLETDSPGADEHPPAPSPPAEPKASPSPPAAPSSASASQTPEYDRLPQLPSPALLVSIPGPSIIHVLSHFNDWFSERLDAYDEALHFVPSTIFAPPALRRKGASSSSSSKTASPAPSTKKEPPKPPLPTAHESHWLLSLLTRLERVLDGEDLANLRLLAKTLVQMAEESEKERLGRVVPPGGRSMEQRLQEEEEAEGRARCWMAVAAVAGVWGQRDLWDSTL
ncbi:hypothetical protein JCM10207_006658 [Rhodosporidiobolus poonsookiae]